MSFLVSASRFTRDQLLTEIRAASQTTNNLGWTDTTILALLDHVYVREFVGMLNANRFLNVQKKWFTMDAAGWYGISNLNNGTTGNRFYRVLGVQVGGIIYRESSLVENLQVSGGTVSNAGDPRWWLDDFPVNTYNLIDASYTGLMGIRFDPINTDAHAVVINTNYYPCIPSRLALGSTPVVFPEGYDMILVFEVAALMLARAGQELGATQGLKALAEEMREAMLADISRFSTNPSNWLYSDTRSEWGG